MLKTLGEIHENRKLKQIVAEHTLDIQALKAVVARNGEPQRSARSGGVAPNARHGSVPTGVSRRRAEYGEVALSTSIIPATQDPSALDCFGSSTFLAESEQTEWRSLTRTANWEVATKGMP